jgi:CopG family nickel-responsive transcriptional regulator
MQRVTVSLDADLVDEIDQFMHARGYQSRSEALRDLARTGLSEAKSDTPDHRQCVAALVYVFNHATRELPKRLTQAFHDHHELSVSSLHVHLDSENCLEVNILRGDTKDVRHFGEHVIAERGIRHGRLVVLPVDPNAR